MEITCTRCHQTVHAENCYCPVCGLPQLVYPVEGPAGQNSPERWDEGARDASSVDWKPALQAALKLAIPAGLLCSLLSPVGAYGFVWMSAAAAWAVVLYVRSQRPAWITIGAGARIGLVTGLLAAWLAFGVGCGTLFVQRFVLHQSGQMDAEWNAYADEYNKASLKMTQQWSSGLEAADVAKLQANQAGIHAMMLSPEGHAGWEVLGLASGAAVLLLFAVAGGALGARMQARTSRTEA